MKLPSSALAGVRVVLVLAAFLILGLTGYDYLQDGTVEATNVVVPILILLVVVLLRASEKKAQAERDPA